MTMPSLDGAFDGAPRHLAMGVAALIGGFAPALIVGLLFGIVSGSNEVGATSALVTVIVCGIGGVVYSVRNGRHAIANEKSAESRSYLENIHRKERLLEESRLRRRRALKEEAEAAIREEEAAAFREEKGRADEERWAEAEKVRQAERREQIRRQNLDSIRQNALLAESKFSSLPKVVSEVERAYGEALFHYKEGAASPFWSAVESAYTELAEFSATLKVIEKAADSHPDQIEAFLSE